MVLRVYEGRICATSSIVSAAVALSIVVPVLNVKVLAEHKLCKLRLQFSADAMLGADLPDRPHRMHRCKMI
jgi:hypothetical protein